MRHQSSAPAHPPTDPRHILEDAREHPEPTRYSERVEAARRYAAEEYRREVRAMMDAGTLDDSEL